MKREKHSGKRKMATIVCGIFMLAVLGACTSNNDSGSIPAQDADSPQQNVTAVASGSFTPGTFTASADSFGGPLTVEVTFAADSIVSINVDHSDTAAWARRAVPTIPQMILHRQSTQDIDVIASATMTSSAVLEAVNDTIVQAGADPSSLVPNIPTQPLPGATFIAGQHIVEAESWDNAPMTMQVVFSQDEIVRIEVLEHGDTTTGANWAGRAIPILPQMVEEVQSTVGIDTVAGATTSSGSVLRLIDEAITLAGANPASLQPIARTPGSFWPYGAGGGNPAIFHPGVYYATAEGFGGPVTVQAIFNRGALVRARVVDHNETQDFFERVFPTEQGTETLATIVESGQTIHGIDVTASATRTHNAYLEAVAEAIRMAGANPDDF